MPVRVRWKTVHSSAMSVIFLTIALQGLLTTEAHAADKLRPITFIMETVCHVDGDGYCEKDTLAMPVRFGTCETMHVFGLDKLNVNKLLVGNDGKMGRVYSEECFESAVIPKGANMNLYPGKAR